VQRTKSKRAPVQPYRGTRKNHIDARQKTSRCKKRSNTQPTARRTLLWIDDYEPGLLAYSAIFERLGFRLLTASRPRIGLDLAAGSDQVDAAIVDYEMPEMDGGEVAAELKRRNPQLPVVLFSGSTIFPDRLRRLADAICDKAEPLERLLAILKGVLAKKSVTLQQPTLRPSSDQAQSAVAQSSCCA
jgi:CheY-like chemotaxis protein